MPEVQLGELTRREILRAAGAGGAVLTLPGFLAACSGDGSPDDAGAGQIGGAGSDAEISSITWAVSAAPATLDIATGFTLPGLLAMMLGLEGLVGVGKDLKLKPLLAQSWSRPDPLRYVYQLRPGVTFWDGTSMTIDDVVFSIARHADPKTASQLSTYFVNVKSVEATGKDEVTINLKAPDPLFQYVPSLTLVTPQAFSEDLGKKLGTAGAKVNTMGTGPYEITSFSTDEGVTVKRHSDYWGDKPRVRTATLKPISDPQTQLLAIRSGEVDGLYDFPPGNGRQWDKLTGVNTDYSQGLGVAFLSFDMESAPWNDIHVRRTFAYAADLKGYVRAFLAGHGEAATSLVSPLQWTGTADDAQVNEIYSNIPQYEFNLDKAKAELAKSAHPDGFSAEVGYPKDEPASGKALVSLSEALKELGITLRVKEISSDDWIARIYAHEDLGLTFAKYEPDYVDPADFPAIMFNSANAVPNQFNLANFKNRQVDRLLAEQAAATEDSVRARAIGEMLRIVGEELPYLPLWWQNATIALSDKYVYDGFNSLYYYTPAWLGNLQARA